MYLALVGGYLLQSIAHGLMHFGENIALHTERTNKIRGIYSSTMTRVHSILGFLAQSNISNQGDADLRHALGERGGADRGWAVQRVKHKSNLLLIPHRQGEWKGKR